MMIMVDFIAIGVEIFVRKHDRREETKKIGFDKTFTCTSKRYIERREREEIERGERREERGESGP